MADGTVTGSFTVDISISSGPACSPSSTTATVSWTTNGPSTSMVFYDTVSRNSTDGYAFPAGDLALVTAHSVGLGGLTASTTYYYRVKSVAADNLTAVSEEQTFATTATGGGTGGGGGGGGGGFGGGAGGGGGGGAAGPGVTNVAMYTNSDGLFNLAATPKSDDGNAQLFIDKGVLAQTKDGGPLKSVSIRPLEDTPPPPDDARLVTLAYEFCPDGATFKPGVTLSLVYDPATLPAGFPERNLSLVAWDTVAAKWVDVQGATVNTEARTVSVTVTHLGRYAVIVRARPASFAIQGLSVSPSKVNIGEPVSITATAINSGDLGGSYTVTLMVAGKQQDKQDLSLSGASQQQVSFTFTPESPGSVDIQVNGLTATVTVWAPSSPSATAVLSIKSLSVEPTVLDFGKEVAISAVVENSGEAAGTHEVSLKIGDALIETRRVSVAPKSTETVGFVFAANAPGTFEVDVDGKKASFTVNPLAEPSAPGTVSWYLIGGIIIAVSAIASLVGFRIREKANYIPPVPPRVQRKQ